MVDQRDGIPMFVWREVAVWVRKCLKESAHWALDSPPEPGIVGKYYPLAIYEYYFTLTIHAKLLGNEWTWVYTLHAVKRYPDENPDNCVSGHIFTDGTFADVTYWAESIIHQRRPAVRLTDENKDYGQW